MRLVYSEAEECSVRRMCLSTTRLKHVGGGVKGVVSVFPVHAASVCIWNGCSSSTKNMGFIKCVASARFQEDLRQSCF